MTHRREVELFSDAMEQSLRANDWKGGWKDCSTRYLFRRLQQELAELELSLNTQQHSNLVAGEAVDVANFAMMIADREGNLEQLVALRQEGRNNA
jgi:hypothetical protein